MFKFTAKADGGEGFDFESDSRDVANWERTTKGAAMGQLAADDGAGMSFTALYKISWFAARRLGLIPDDMPQAVFQSKYALDLRGDDELVEVEGDELGGDDELDAEPV